MWGFWARSMKSLGKVIIGTSVVATPPVATVIGYECGVVSNKNSKIKELEATKKEYEKAKDDSLYFVEAITKDITSKDADGFWRAVTHKSNRCVETAYSTEECLGVKFLNDGRWQFKSGRIITAK